VLRAERDTWEKQLKAAEQNSQRHQARADKAEQVTPGAGRQAAQLGARMRSMAVSHLRDRCGAGRTGRAGRGSAGEARGAGRRKEPPGRGQGQQVPGCPAEQVRGNVSHGPRHAGGPLRPPDEHPAPRRALEEVDRLKNLLEEYKSQKTAATTVSQGEFERVMAENKKLVRHGLRLRGAMEETGARSRRRTSADVVARRPLRRSGRSRSCWPGSGSRCG